MAEDIPTQEEMRTLVEALYETKAHPNVRDRSHSALMIGLARLYRTLAAEGGVLCGNCGATYNKYVASTEDQHGVGRCHAASGQGVRDA